MDNQQIRSAKGELYAQNYQETRQSGKYPLSLVIYIDAAPAFRKKKYSLYFILGSILELPNMKRQSDNNVILFGLWGGKSTTNIDFFLQPFADQMVNIKYFTSDANHYDYVVKVYCVLADLVAKAFILQCKRCNGKFGCCVCLQQGEQLVQGQFGSPWIWRYIANIPLRTDETFAQDRAIAIENNICYMGIKPLDTPLSNIINIPSQTPLDPFHLIFEGSVKRLLILIFNANQNEQYSIKRFSQSINTLLANVKMPHNFHRKAENLAIDPKSLKGSEYILFIFYLLPIIKDFIPDEYLEHFMKLSVAVRLLYETPINEEKLTLCDNLLNNFVQEVENLYDLQQNTYNVHGLCHLANQVNFLGTLHDITAQLFESAIGIIKRHYNGSRNVIGQIAENLMIYFHLREYTIENNKRNEWTLLTVVDKKYCRLRHNVKELEGCSCIYPVVMCPMLHDTKHLLEQCMLTFSIEYKSYIQHLLSINTYSRMIMANVMYHSIMYSKRGKSCSYYDILNIFDPAYYEFDNIFSF
jgi:hypothetical protein